MDTIRSAWSEVLHSVRHPEELARRQQELSSPWVIPVLLLVATAGVGTFGMISRAHLGAVGMLEGLLKAPAAAGLAWVIALPSLYIIGAAFGSKLKPRGTLLAAAIVTCFAGLAMLASVPVAWLFGLALPSSLMRIVVVGFTLAGVGLCMSDVFLRVMRTLDPQGSRLFPMVWLTILASVGAEMFLIFDVFDL